MTNKLVVWPWIYSYNSWLWSKNKKFPLMFNVSDTCVFLKNWFVGGRGRWMEMSEMSEITLLILIKLMSVQPTSPQRINYPCVLLNFRCFLAILGLFKRGKSKFREWRKFLSFFFFSRKNEFLLQLFNINHFFLKCFSRKWIFTKRFTLLQPKRLLQDIGSQLIFTMNSKFFEQTRGRIGFVTVNYYYY